MKYIILTLIILLILIFYLSYLDCNYIDTFDNSSNESESWSKIWNESDFKARENADCNPIEKKWVDFGNISAWIWTVPKSCEQGLPHTRYEDVIAMPESYSGPNYDATIEHEKIHLYQRRYTTEWYNFYKNEWDYEIFNDPPSNMPKNIIEKRRSNPDTCFGTWCRWRNRWWSVPIYNNNFSLSRAKIIWYDEKENKILDNCPSEWNEFFGYLSYNEHPNEISAVFLSGPLFKKDKSDDSLKPAMKKLLDKWDWSENPVFPQ